MINHPSVKCKISCLTLLAGAAIAGQAQAGGFALIEQGASGLGNAYAGASAVSRDASTVWLNPAGMLELKDPQLAVAGHVIGVNSTFTDRGTTLNPAFDPTVPAVPGAGEVDTGGASFLPNFYYVRGINEDLTFGFGFSVPFGNSTEYGRDWVGRYQAVESAVTVLDFNPTIAYRVNPQVNIGAGISVQMFDVALAVRLIPLQHAWVLHREARLLWQIVRMQGLTNPGDLASDGYADIAGDSVAATFNLGVLFKPRVGTRIGLAYRHSVDHELEGDADFTTNDRLATVLANAGVPLFSDVAATAEATLPSSAMLSIAHQVNDQVELLADATFTGWSSLKELRVKFDSPVQPDTFNTLGYKDVWRVAAGLNYFQSDKLTLRAGVAYDEDPVPSVQLRTPRIPGNERTWLSFGLGYKVSDQMNFDLGFAHLFLDDTPIDNTSESPGGTTIRGEYETDANIVSAQINYKFK